MCNYSAPRCIRQTDNNGRRSCFEWPCKIHACKSCRRNLMQDQSIDVTSGHFLKKRPGILLPPPCLPHVISAPFTSNMQQPWISYPRSLVTLLTQVIYSARLTAEALPVGHPPKRDAAPLAQVTPSRYAADCLSWLQDLAGQYSPEKGRRAVTGREKYSIVRLFAT